MKIALLRDILLATEIICALIAIGTFKKWKGTYWSYFILYLAFIAIAESVGYYLRTHELRDVSQAMYTFIVIPVEFLFFFWLFTKLLPSRQASVIAITGACIYIACVLLEEFVVKIEGFYFHSLSYTVGNIFLLILIFVLMNRLLDSKELSKLQSNASFWLIAGLLTFYLLSFPFYGLFNYLVNNMKEFSRSYYKATLILNCLMYLMFLTGLLWAKPKSSYS